MGGQPGVTLSRSFSWLHGQHASSPPEISVSRSLQPEESIFMPPPLTPASFLPLRARTDYRASPCTRQVPAAVKKKEEGGEATNNFFFFSKFCQERRVREESWFKLFLLLSSGVVREGGN